MIKGFKDFVLRGNVVDLAVAVAVGAAFTAVVTAFTDAIINPLLAAVGGADVPGLGFFLRENQPETFVDIGGVLAAIINFLIVAAAIYVLIVVPVNRLMTMRKRGQEPEVQAPSEDILLLQEIRDLLRAQDERR